MCLSLRLADVADGARSPCEGSGTAAGPSQTRRYLFDDGCAAYRGWPVSTASSGFCTSTDAQSMTSAAVNGIRLPHSARRRQIKSVGWVIKRERSTRVTLSDLMTGMVQFPRDRRHHYPA